MLLVVEATDVVFAVDSIPAIFAVTRDPFIVFTSNIFAILGLRALYFVLKTIMDAFRFLKVGLGLVLVFVGAKMCTEKWVHVPAEISLLVVVSLLGALRGRVAPLAGEAGRGRRCRAERRKSGGRGWDGGESAMVR